MMKEATRGGLYVSTSPPKASWHGEAFPITVTQAHIMYKLVRDGSVSNTNLSQHVNGDLRASKNAISAIRRRLPPGVSIVSRKGWGYALELKDKDMTTVRDKVAASVPADAQGAVLIVVGSDGKAVSTAFDVHPGGALVLLSVAVRGIGEKILPVAKPVVDADDKEG